MPSTDPDRPNVIVVLTDDQGYWAMGCAGNPEVRTPNLDRLAATGTRFENFFCVTPVCSAARAALLTGRIASQNGVHDWIAGGKDIEFLEGQPGYTDVLARNGYVCGLSGKWHLGDASFPQKGFTFWRPRAGGGYTEPAFYDEDGAVHRPGGYLTDAITDNALDFLDARLGDDRPFYLSVHHIAPHSPWRREHHPAEYFEPYYDHCPLESAPREPKHPDDAGITDFFDSPERRREKLSGYYAAITAMDANLGRILGWLRRHGLTGNTVVFFTSDNGMNMGHHGVCGKGNGTLPVNLFDTSVKVPGIISRPGHIPEGRLCDGLYSHYDFHPTLLDYLGLEDPEAEALPGTSFAHLLRGEEEREQGQVVVFDEYGPVRMVRTHEWKYIRRYREDRPDELYHLTQDPGETENLIEAREQADRVEKMRKKLGNWFERYVDPTFDGSKLPATGCGQRKMAYEPDAFAQSWPESWLHK